MVRARTLIVAVASGMALVALPAAPANAVTTVGTPSGVGTSFCSPQYLNYETAGPGVVTTPGVVTSLTARSTTVGGTASVKVMRGTLVVGTTPILTISATYSASATGLHIPAQVGDSLGIYITGAGNACSTNDGSASLAYVASATDPQPGTSLSGALIPLAAHDIAVSGTLEADADGDTYGDETQDACPADPARHLSPCTSDLAVTVTPLAGTVTVGELTAVKVAVQNLSNGPATASSVDVTPLPGLDVVGASTSCASGPTLHCTLGSIDASATSTVLVVLRATKTGALNVVASATSAQTDPNQANSSAIATITVNPAAAAGPAQCVVPKVVGLPTSFAKQLLAAKGCKLGKTSKKKSAGKKGVIAQQAKKPGAKLPAGTAVAVTVRT